jgi:predicted acyl esterase
VKLQVKTSAPDTCFYVRLSLVRKDGTALALRDDIDSVLRTNPDYQSGGVAEIDYQFAPHSFMIGEGERLRLDVSSSCFPHFHIHTNRKGIQTMQTGADIAKNTILTGESVLRIYTGELETN